jgi:hypothetical protein
MFCPQCGAQSETPAKFCRACGLKLSEYAQSLANAEIDAERENRERAQHEIRQLKGTRALSAFFLVNLLLAFLLIVAAEMVRGREGETMAVILFILWLLSTLLGGWGIYNLWRGAFFETRKERLIRAEALLLEQKRQTGKLAPAQYLPPERIPTIASHASPVAEVSVVEHTTRELQPMPSNSGKID